MLPAMLRTLLLVASVGGCWSASEPSDKLFTYMQRGTDGLEIFTGQPSDHPDAVPVVTLANLSDATLAFALELHREIGGQVGESANILFSPVSIVTTLALAYLGAGGRTKDQIGRVLHLGSLGEADVHRTFRALLGSLTSRNDVVLDVATRMFTTRGLGVKTSYSQAARDFYNCSIDQVDFAKEGESTRKTINIWVEHKTHGKIRHLLQEPLDPATLMVLVNAVYFKGQWQFRFERREEVKEYFHVGAGNRVPVTMMSLENPLPFGHWPSPGVTVVALPYTGMGAAMYIALPDAHVSLAELERRLTPDLLRSIQNGLQERNVTLVMPRFKMEAGGSLAKALTALGAADLFASATSNLTELSSTANVMLGDLVHRAAMDVTEDGTEAAAASALIGLRNNNPNQPLVVVDRPFLLCIMDTNTGVVLFFGRVVNPGV